MIMVDKSTTHTQQYEEKLPFEAILLTEYGHHCIIYQLHLGGP